MFTGNGEEPLQDFLKRIEEDCTRRSANTDHEKLAIFNALISYENDSFAGKVVRSTKFRKIYKNMTTM